MTMEIGNRDAPIPVTSSKKTLAFFEAFFAVPRPAAPVR